MRAGPGRLLPALVLCAACFGGSAPVAAPPPLPDEEVAAFSVRIEGFYHQLEDVPLDALVTYQNRQLRDCFETPGAFSDYFSALATAARDAYFRDKTARSVQIRQFQFAGPEEATVEVYFKSVHERVLRFWSIGFERADHWKRTDGVWRIVPEKL
ncbi:MAG: hypothetical protein ACHQ6T_00610 [Myxococcota bacterium]